MSQTTRRTFLDVSATAALAGIAAASVTASPAAAHPDAELLNLCAQQEQAWQAAENLVEHLGDIYGVDLPEEAFDQEAEAFLTDRAIQDQVAATPALTPQGLAAKAKVLQRQLGYARAPQPSSEHGLAWSLAADLLRGIA